MKATLMALGVTAAFAAGGLTQDRPNGSEAREVRAYLLDQNKNPAPLRNVTAAIVVPGKNGAPDRSTPMILEVPLKADAPREAAKPSRPQSGKVEGTSLSVEVMVCRPVSASGPKPGDPPPPREGPYFRAILDRTTLGEDGAFWVVFTIDGEKRAAKGFSCRFDAAKTFQDLERAVAVRDADRAKTALARLQGDLAKESGGDPHREVRARALEKLGTALDVNDWDQVSKSLEECRAARAECAEKCEPAPADERRRP